MPTTMMTAAPARTRPTRRELAERVAKLIEELEQLEAEVNTVRGVDRGEVDRGFGAAVCGLTDVVYALDRRLGEVICPN